MEDILENPSAWARRAVGTPLRLIVAISLHGSLLILGWVFAQPAFVAAAGLALPSLYLYALYRLLRTSTSSESARDDQLERTSARSATTRS